VPVALLGSGCNDNVGCVFTPGCNSNGPGAIGDGSAFLPVDGDFIASAKPTIAPTIFPSGITSAPTTPIVLLFSETMQEDSLVSAIEVVSAGGAVGPPVSTRQALVSDGRVLVLLPVTPLAAGAYSVRLAQDAAVLDLSGQAPDLEAGAELGTFTVSAAPPSVPQLLMTFPADNAIDQAETTEIVVVFDRPVVESSITGDSFDVQVNGVDPINDPAPTPIVVEGGVSGGDPRVFLYRRLDADDLPARFGKDVEVRLVLSPNGELITEPDGDALAASTINFQTLAFSPPVSATFLTDPPDAIGLANLTKGNAEELMVEVQLDAAEPNDTVDLYLFGKDKSAQTPTLIALLRSQRVTGVAPIGSVTFTLDQIPLLNSDTPTDVRFQDGAVTFAFVLRRGAASSPVRVLDFDPDPDTIQDPLLDTTLPTVANWLGSTGTDEFRSDQRGLALAGLASEKVRSVEVSTPLGDNGPLAPVVGSQPVNPLNPNIRVETFLAASVPLGRLDSGTTTFSAVVRDRAENPTAAIAGDFFQFGAVGPDPFTPGQSITVEVFDAATLKPIAGARVLVHSDQGNGIDFPFERAGTTGTDGTVTLATDPAPSVGAIVTVDRDGFDLFTLHGVPSTRLSIPLRASAQDSANARGEVATTDAASLAIAGLDVRYDDSRRAVVLPRAFPGDDCGPGSNGGIACNYGPEPIAPNRLGARSFFAGDFSQTELGFDPAEILQAFLLLVPLAPAAPNAPQLGNFTLTSLLVNAGASEAAQGVPPFRFRLPAPGVVTGQFDVDPDATGILRVGVECLVPGLGGAIAVGPGASFNVAVDLWTVLAAYPGAITAAGSLGSVGAVDTDPFVRVELADTVGNAVGIRPRLSTILAGGPLPEFKALDIARLTSPAPAAHTGSEAFTLALAQAIGDDRTEPGVYRVELVDIDQRGWTLWRFDPAGAADVLVRAVDLADGGGVGLADGDIAATSEAFAWSSLSLTDFLWSASSSSSRGPSRSRS
jgi:hypothetical protein